MNPPLSVVSSVSNPIKYEIETFSAEDSFSNAICFGKYLPERYEESAPLFISALSQSSLCDNPEALNALFNLLVLISMYSSFRHKVISLYTWCLENQTKRFRKLNKSVDREKIMQYSLEN